MLLPLDPINAECIFAPLHDPMFAGELNARVESGSASGVSGEQQWCWHTITWSNAIAGEVAAYLTVPWCEEEYDFDHLIACVTVPANVSVALELCIEGAWRRILEPMAGLATRMDLTAPLPDGRPSDVRLVFISHEPGAACVITHWLGLGDSRRLKLLTGSNPGYSPSWHGLLKPREQWGEPLFAAGLLFSETGLTSLRHKRTLPAWWEHFALLEKRARRAMKQAPETQISDYAPFTDERYIRQREQGRWSYYLEGPVAAVVGLVLNDAPMIEWACRTLLCMVHTTYWCQSAESRLRGSTWTQMCFVEEEMTSAAAIMADCLDFALTDRARDLIRSSIWDKGLAVIERDMMRHEYVHHMNQGPWFCRARILGGLLLEKGWPRMDGYVDRAVGCMRAAMDRYVLADGGTDEGLGYWSLTMHMVLQGLMAYSRMRNLDARNLLPANQTRSEAFLSIMSAVEPGRVLMDGDNSTDYLVGDTIPILAQLYPESAYSKILGSCLLEEREFTYFNHYIADGLWGFVLGPQEIPAARCIVPAFGRLECTGHATSLRVSGEHSERIHFAGCKANPSHSHFDKSSFTLELDGCAALIDRGTVRYDDPRCEGMSRTCLHNVLTTVLPDGSFAGQSASTQALIPQGSGDGKTLDLTMDVTALWAGHFTECTRRIESRDMGRFSVVDQGRRTTPGKIAFHLHAPLPFQVEGKTAFLRIEETVLRIEFPWADSVTQSPDGIDYEFREVHHLIATRDVGGEAFSLTTSFECQPEK